MPYVDRFSQNFLPARWSVSYLLMYTWHTLLHYPHGANAGCDLAGVAPVVHTPFQQLMSVHTFDKTEDGNTKQVSLAFCLMSRRRKRDYKKVSQIRYIYINYSVLCSSCGLLKYSGSNPTPVFFHKTQFSCSFIVHAIIVKWNLLFLQVFRCLSELLPPPPPPPPPGSGAGQRLQGWPCIIGIHKNWTVLALAFLPAEHIQAAWRKVNSRVHGDEQFKALLAYVRTTWLESTVWDCNSWSLYHQAIRTNNDVKGWHNRVNSKAGQQPPFFQLLQILHREARLVPLQVGLLNKGCIVHLQHATTVPHHPVPSRATSPALGQLWPRHADHGTTAYLSNCKTSIRWQCQLIYLVTKWWLDLKIRIS